MRLSGNLSNEQLWSLVVEKLVKLDVQVSTLQHHLIHLHAELTHREEGDVAQEVQQLTDHFVAKLGADLAALHDLTPADLDLGDLLGRAGGDEEE
jgi:hypothetical protein